MPCGRKPIHFCHLIRSTERTRNAGRRRLSVRCGINCARAQAPAALTSRTRERENRRTSPTIEPILLATSEGAVATEAPPRRPGRGTSFNAASSPSSTKRRFVHYTVDVPTDTFTERNTDDQYSPGTNPGEVDTGAFRCRNDHVPRDADQGRAAADGSHPGAFRRRTGTLDETFSSPVPAAYSGCPAG